VAVDGAVQFVSQPCQHTMSCASSQLLSPRLVVVIHMVSVYLQGLLKKLPPPAVALEYYKASCVTAMS
jgi:hypothetical protein